MLGRPWEATADADIIEARYVDIVPDVRVVQAVDFISDDPAFAGTMTMIWEVNAVDRGTRVVITAHDVPGGISAEDHAIGLASSLANLAESTSSGKQFPELGEVTRPPRHLVRCARLWAARRRWPAAYVAADRARGERRDTGRARRRLVWSG